MAVVAVVLLEMLLRQVHRIERGAGLVWQAGKEVARNTATTWLLPETSKRLDMLTDEAMQHVALLTPQTKPLRGGAAMTPLLVTLTIVEIVLVAVVLVYYLLRISASLRRTSALLGKVAFGVRAIESQCNVIGPSVLTVNDQLAGVAGALSRPDRPRRRSRRPAPKPRLSARAAAWRPLAVVVQRARGGVEPTA